MDKRKENENYETIQLLQDRLTRSADEIQMPESLSAENLFARMDEEAEPVIDLASARQRKMRYVLSAVASAAVFVLIFGGYYAATKFATQRFTASEAAMFLSLRRSVFACRARDRCRSARDAAGGRLHGDPLRDRQRGDRCRELQQALLRPI
jgi:small-conductance mechanosensitive channel